MPEAIDVLIVEDDPMVAAIHRQFIGAVSGFIVAGVVSSGKDALEFLQRHPVRLVILDVFLPGMDGVATLQKIREMNRTVGVIVVSASRDTNTINAVLKAGAFDYVIKPFVFELIGKYHDGGVMTPQGAMTTPGYPAEWLERVDFGATSERDLKKLGGPKLSGSFSGISL